LEQALGDLLDKEHPEEGEIVAQIETVPEGRDHKDTVGSKESLLGVSLGFSFTADSEIDVILEPDLRSRVPGFNSVSGVISKFNTEGSNSDDLAVLVEESFSFRFVIQTRTGNVGSGDHPSRIVSASLNQHGSEQITEFVEPSLKSIRGVNDTISIVFGGKDNNNSHEPKTGDQITERSKESARGLAVGLFLVDEVVVIVIFTSGADKGVGIEIHVGQVFKEVGELSDLILGLVCRELGRVLATILIAPGQHGTLANVHHENCADVHLVTTPINPHSVDVEDGEETHGEDEDEESFVSSKEFHGEINNKSHSQWVNDIGFVNQKLEAETKDSSNEMSESGARDGSEDKTERIRDQKTKNHLDLISRNTNLSTKVFKKMIDTESHHECLKG
jgi:hypothetical protein